MVSKAPAKKTPAKSGGRTTAKGTKPASRGMTPAPLPVLQQLTADQLKTVKLAETDVPIPELGGSVRIRQFNGATAKKAREYATDPDTGKVDEDKFEIASIAFGMIDPVLSIEEVAELYDAQAAGAMRRIALAVISLNATGQADAIAKLFG